MSNPSLLQAAIAAHRFGLGEPTLDAITSDPQQWLLAQIGPAEAARGEGLLSTAQALEHVAAEREKRRQAKNPPAGMTAEQVLAGHYREVIIDDARSRLLTAATSTRPFAERLQLFWANHFTVSLAKGATRGLVAPSSATRSGRTSQVRSRRCCSHRPPTRRCCVTSTTCNRPARTRASWRARRAAQSKWAKARASPA